MPIRAAFFESTGGDRRYTADRWAQIFAAIVTQGYIPGFNNGLQVVESSPPAMSVQILTGAGFIQGRYIEVYTTPISLVIGAAHATQYRRDLVILRLDLSSGVRDIVATVKAGALAATAGAAVYPALQRDATIYEVALAGVLVNPADTAIQNAEITDLRENVAYWGRSSFPDLTLHKAAAVLDHPDGSVTDAKIGTRSTDGNVAAPTTDGPFTYSTWLAYLANRIWHIGGGANWRAALPASVTGLHNRLTTTEAQLGGRYANDAASQIPVYDGNRRVYDALHVRGIYGATAAGYLAVYDGNIRVHDTNYFTGQPQSYYATAAGLTAANAAIAAINSVRAYTQVSFPSAAYIPAGYVRLSAADGRVLIGGGTTFGVPFNEGTQVGSSWSHNHAAAGLTTPQVTTTGDPVNGSPYLAQAPGNTTAYQSHGHIVPAMSVAGATSQGQWIVPALVVAHAQKQP